VIPQPQNRENDLIGFPIVCPCQTISSGEILDAMSYESLASRATSGKEESENPRLRKELHLGRQLRALSASLPGLSPYRNLEV
jgi:hypothetical protein